MAKYHSHLYIVKGGDYKDKIKKKKILEPDIASTLKKLNIILTSYSYFLSMCLVH